MLQSSKKKGIFEETIIESVKEHFQKHGYVVSTHARLNVAWSNIVSDIDVIAVSGDEVVIIEVKSSHDCFNRGFDQLRKLRGFADKLYIATDKELERLNLNNWEDDSIGLLHIKNHETEVTRVAKRTLSLSNQGTLYQLKRKCLTKLAELLEISSCLTKKQIERILRDEFDEADLKILAKNIALCQEVCQTRCILEPFLLATCNNLKSRKTAFLGM